ncbi:MAG: hypothetical protein QOD53_248 [Thermoleophilaceae bacterium]|nr:hypothetical protein [Thermoleophilaceae bacterium]
MRFSRASLLIGLLAALVVASPAGAKPPPIKHVWIVLLENENAATSFGPGSPAPYLATTLRHRGQFLPNYYGITHASLGNYLALVSGQGSNAQTRSDCQTFTEFTPGNIGASGQAQGQGCVYPASVQTIANQLQAKGLSWREYAEDMGSDLARDGSATCAHPTIGTHDNTLSASPTDQYATRHNPFVYFHSLLNNGSCAQNDVSLAPLQGDLGAGRVPSYTFITPDLCHDGHDANCADGGPGGLPAANGFLQTWIPKIQATKPYRDGGMIVVTFDEAHSDSTTCCNQPANLGQASSAGGGRVGAVVLSKYVKPGTTNATAYNHYGLLRSFEDLFGLGHLGYAGEPGLKAFGNDVYNACREGDDRPVPHHGRYHRGAVISSASIHSHTVSIRMRHPARVSGVVSGHTVLGPRTLAVCKTYKFHLSRRHGKLTLRARRGHGVEQRVLRF